MAVVDQLMHATPQLQLLLLLLNPAVEQTLDAERRHLVLLDEAEVGVGRLERDVVVAAIQTDHVDLLVQLLGVEVEGAFAAGLLVLVIPPQLVEVDVDAFGGQLLLLLLQLLHQLLLPTVFLLLLEFFAGNRLAGAGLRMGVVRRSTWALK